MASEARLFNSTYQPPTFQLPGSDRRPKKGDLRNFDDKIGKALKKLSDSITMYTLKIPNVRLKGPKQAVKEPMKGQAAKQEKMMNISQGSAHLIHWICPSNSMDLAKP